MPGGGQHFGEALEEAVRRECAEEVQLDVAVGPLRYVQEYLGQNHEFAEADSDSHQVEFWFECESVGTLVGAEGVPDVNQIGYEWIGIERIAEIPVFPQVIRRLPLSDMSFTGNLAYLVD